jgi:hypothetical protein
MKKLLAVTLSALGGLALVLGGTGAGQASPVGAGAPSLPATFRGAVNGDHDQHSVHLQPGLVVVRARHSGSSNFIVNLRQPKPGESVRESTGPSVHLINHIGQYNGGSAGQVTEPGPYMLELSASGSYEVIVEQPPLSRVAAPEQHEFSGTGQQVTPVFVMPAGARRITFAHDGVASYGPNGLAQVFLLAMSGDTVSGESGRLFQHFGPYSGEVVLEVILEEAHIFHVFATGAWTLRID